MLSTASASDYSGRHVQRGVPIVGLRTATHAFAGLKAPWEKYNNGAKGDWEGGFGRFVLGEKWVNHHGAHKKEGTRGIIEPTAKTVDELKKLNLPAGVDIQIKI